MAAASLLLALFILYVAIRQQDWRLFLKDHSKQHVCAVSVVILMALWALQTGIRDGLEVHFLGLTALTLMLGWRLSLLTASLALMLTTLLGLSPWYDLGLQLLLGIIWPVSLSYFVFLLIYSYLPRHLFIYTFIAGFFNGALTITAKMLAFALYFYFTETHSWSAIFRDYLTIIPLLLFPEGLINGMSITALVVYKPEWVCTFLDKDYLQKKE